MQTSQRQPVLGTHPWPLSVDCSEKKQQQKTGPKVLQEGPQSHVTVCLWHRVLRQMSRLMTKPTKWHVRPAKTQISLGIRPVWSEFSLCAKYVAKNPSFLHADSEDSEQTGRMPRLIWVFAGRTCHFVGFVMRRLKQGQSRVPQDWLVTIKML